jgi:hypothetical protein
MVKESQAVWGRQIDDHAQRAGMLTQLKPDIATVEAPDLYPACVEPFGDRLQAARTGIEQANGRTFRAGGTCGSPIIQHGTVRNDLLQIKLSLRRMKTQFGQTPMGFHLGPADVITGNCIDVGRNYS